MDAFANFVQSDVTGEVSGRKMNRNISSGIIWYWIESSD